MFIKSIFFLCILLHTHCMQSTSFVAHLIINRQKQYTDTIAQERKLLFVQAEEHEELFITTKSKCLEKGNCDTDEYYHNAQKSVLVSITALNEYLKELEEKKDNSCILNEMIEAKNIKKRLEELSSS